MTMFREPWELILGGSPKELKNKIFFLNYGSSVGS